MLKPIDLVQQILVLLLLVEGALAEGTALIPFTFLLPFGVEKAASVNLPQLGPSLLQMLTHLLQLALGIFSVRYL